MVAIWICLYRTDSVALSGKLEGVKVFNARSLNRELEVVESIKSLCCRGNAVEPSESIHHPKRFVVD
jgi:hypothetical protein